MPACHVEYEYEEGSVEGGYYRIRVWRSSKPSWDLSANILEPTMNKAWEEFERLGFKRS